MATSSSTDQRSDDVLADLSRTTTAGISTLVYVSGELVAEIINGSPGVHSSTESGDQLVKALQAVLEDETFKFNSKAAMEARQTAVLLLEWAKNQDNLSRIKQFLQQLQEDCLKFLTPGSIYQWRSYSVETFCTLSGDIR